MPVLILCGLLILKGCRLLIDQAFNESGGVGLVIPDLYATSLGNGSFDFAATMAHVSRAGGNSNQSVGIFPDDGTGMFIKFENSSTLEIL
jgi:hypothetical protein